MKANDGIKKILMVDDDEVHLLIANSILKDKYETISAKSGKEAISLITKGLVPSLILLDVLMPEMDGWETYNIIKGISLLQNVPIVFLTTLDGENERQYAARLGAADLITKPCHGDELLEKIGKIIDSRTE